MVCIYCGASTRVKNSRLQRRTNQTWRRRQCEACLSLFTTLEQPELRTGLLLQLRDGSLTPFNRDRLFIDVYESCKHRPSPIRDASALTQTILAKALKNPTSAAVHRDVLVQTALGVLKRFDRAAATIYAAYHPL